MSPNLIVAITLIAFAAAFAVYWFYFRPWWTEIADIQEDLDKNAGIPKHHCKFKRGYTQTTAKGVRVLSTVKTPAIALESIDEAINRLLANFAVCYPNWTKYKSHKDYRIALIDPSGFSVETLPGAPILHIRGYGSAGTVVGTWPHCASDKPYIVVPHQQGLPSHPDWYFMQFFRNANHAEGEHVHEAMNDYDVYLSKIGAGDVHLHCGEWADLSAEMFSCGFDKNDMK